MALLDDFGKGATSGNLAIGIGAALLAPVLAPVVSSVLRPSAKAVLSTGITLYRSAMEPISAAVGNLVTEAQLELATASSVARRSAQATTADEAPGAAPGTAAGAATEATTGAATDDTHLPRAHKHRRAAASQ